MIVLIFVLSHKTVVINKYYNVEPRNQNGSSHPDNLRTNLFPLASLTDFNL